MLGIEESDHFPFLGLPRAVDEEIGKLLGSGEPRAYLARCAVGGIAPWWEDLLRTDSAHGGEKDSKTLQKVAGAQASGRKTCQTRCPVTRAREEAQDEGEVGQEAGRAGTEAASPQGRAEGQEEGGCEAVA
jgi:hypothetical protein